MSVTSIYINEGAEVVEVAQLVAKQSFVLFIEFVMLSLLKLQMALPYLLADHFPLITS
jgi:hypothetical protein